MNSRYEQPFQEFVIIPTAMDEWQRFVGERSGLDAVIDLSRMHVAHVRNVLAENDNDAAMGFFVTDIPDYDLALVDLHSDTGMRHVTLMDRASSLKIAAHILNIPTGTILH